MKYRVALNGMVAYNDNYCFVMTSEWSGLLQKGDESKGYYEYTKIGSDTNQEVFEQGMDILFKQESIAKQLTSFKALYEAVRDNESQQVINALLLTANKTNDEKEILPN